MGEHSNIQWCDVTWNIARGCSKVDEDCKYCYMFRDSMNGTRYDPKTVVRTKTVFNLPLKLKMVKSDCWDGPPLIFTSSLTDVFHESIDPYRNEMWDIIRKRPDMIFQILTKRPERIMQHLPEDWGKGWNNVWLGTSVGNQKGIERMFHLMHATAKTRFISIEPLWGEVELDEEYDLSPMDCGAHFAEYIDWVIVGGESGHETGKYTYRPCQLKWIEDIVNACKEHEIPVFVKQLGTFLSKQLGMSDRHGGNIAEFPEHLQIRQFPKL